MKTYAFQAETKELLQLMIHSLYSNREIFLRELLSNASDALEKAKFEGLTHPEYLADYGIKIESDPLKRLLVVEDNGIGMTEEELLANLGTIAHSGTKAFLQALGEKRSELIGQFGVGFYAAFMVAERVRVVTRKPGCPAYAWESDGSGEYTVTLCEKEGHGTRVELFLKTHEDGVDYTESSVVRMLVKKYSDFLAFPIRMGDEVLNVSTALWMRSPVEITHEEYANFYKHLGHDWQDPLKTIHYKAEGTSEFTALVYVPKELPRHFDYRDAKVALSLYVQRVFIKSDCEELLPSYLRFMVGLADSSELQLNVSRETLQDSPHMTRMRKALTSKILSTFKEMLGTDRSQYDLFWAQFGSILKEGMLVDPQNTSKIQDLVLFSIASDPSQRVTLAEYCAKMPAGQKRIYCQTGDSLESAVRSPYLESVRSHGYDVLLMTDRVDAWVAGSLREYGGYEVQACDSKDLDIGSDAEKAISEEKKKVAHERLHGLVSRMSTVLADTIEEVRLTDRLKDSAVCLVGGAMTAHMERILKQSGQDLPQQKRILEMNPEHPVFEKMLHMSEVQVDLWTSILYQQALLREGTIMPDPQKYTQQITQLMVESVAH